MSAAVEAWVVAVLAGPADGAQRCEADGGDDGPEQGGGDVEFPGGEAGVPEECGVEGGEDAGDGGGDVEGAGHVRSPLSVGVGVLMVPIPPVYTEAV